MLLIVAHHYVVNSGLSEVLRDAPLDATSISMILFGAWGKTGINCFVIITGWFMCRSSISGRKLLRLYLQLALYAVAIYAVFCITGHERFSPLRTAFLLFPVRSINDGFVSCFLLFYLFIPFLNMLIQAIGRKNHLLLLLLALTVYTLLPSAGIRLSFNYVSWFMILYLLASYIRFYGLPFNPGHRGWGMLTLLSIAGGSACILAFAMLYKQGHIGSWSVYWAVADSNKLFALATAVSSFMWFKDLKIPRSKLINAIGATTFGVLLIHANSDAMRQWLWRDTVDCVGHFGPSLLWTLGYAVISVLVIFTVCAGIDWFRGRFIEPPLMRLFGRLEARLRPLLRQLG